MNLALGGIVLEDFVSSFHFTLLTWNIFCKMHVLLSIFPSTKEENNDLQETPLIFQKEKFILKLYYICT